VKELAERMDDLVSDTDRNDFDRGQGNVAEYVRHALSRLLPSQLPTAPGLYEGPRGARWELDAEGQWWFRGYPDREHPTPNQQDRTEFDVLTYGMPLLPSTPNPDDCGNCWVCINASGSRAMGYVLCPECGNKRCPKASNHKLDCTHSNASGQPGSVYTARPSTPTEEGKTDD
jgi:hypothetical protein